MGKKNKKARESNYYRQRAKKKLWIIAIILVVVLGAGFMLLQGTQSVDYTEVRTDRPFYGPEDAEIVFVEYADFQCPACGAWHPLVTQVKEQYADRVRFEYRHFPIGSFPHSRTAAMAAECAHDQDAFWEYADLNFANQDRLSQRNIWNEQAEILGLDVDMFDTCMRSGVKGRHVDADRRQGVAQGVDSTPTFFVNGERIRPTSMSAQALSSAIDAALSS